MNTDKRYKVIEGLSNKNIMLETNDIEEATLFMYTDCKGFVKIYDTVEKKFVVETIIR